MPGVAFVPSDGPDKADVVLVGEAPGFHEGKEGRPFTGPSGQLLNTVLEHVGVSRQESFVTNCCLCRPAGNRTPSKGEINCCSDRLMKEIKSREPKTIVAMGAPAAKAIAGKQISVTTYRAGPPKTSPLYPGVRFIPTAHPAYCMRSTAVFPMFVTDMQKITRPVNIKFEEPTYKVFDDYHSASRVIYELANSRFPELVVDIEVGMEKDQEFIHPDQYKLLCVGIGHEPGKAIVLGEQAVSSPQILPLLGQLLERKRWVAHNGKFDLAGLWKVGHGQLHFDTMLASYALDERPGAHGLKYLATELLGAPDYSSGISRYIGKDRDYSRIPRDELYRYNAFDVVSTGLLRQRYAQELGKEGLLGLHDFLCKASQALMPMEMEGVRVDQEELSRLEDSYLDDLDKRERGLARWVDNPRSPIQVKEALKELGAKVASTNEQTLKDLSESSTGERLDFIKQMLGYRRENKLYGTYVKGIRKRLYRGRVHTTFLLHGTVTGRLASRNPNLQNIPRESSIRRLFVPDEGNVFVQGDYATIELRVMAVEAQDAYLRTMFQEQRDIHDEVAREQFGENFTHEDRMRAKNITYGLLYDREVFSLTREYGWTEKYAAWYIERFFNLIPDTWQWKLAMRKRVLEEQEDLVTSFGRHRRFWLVTRENKKDIIKESMAFIPQSTASDINLEAAVRLRNEGIAVRIPVHDSLLAECAREDAAEVGVTMKRVMEDTAREVYSDYVDFPVDLKQGDSWFV